MGAAEFLLLRQVQQERDAQEAARAEAQRDLS